ncbi:MAG: MSHA biogenesis protein MshL [Kiritimatiellia bacterium]|jgi:MSHA biogenesis protein MshL
MFNESIKDGSVILTKKITMLLVVLVLSACATRPASLPDTSILGEIQETLDAAVLTPSVLDSSVSAEDDVSLLDELIPSLSLDDSLLAPVEVRTSISTRANLSATDFFNDLFTGTDYGVVVGSDVDVQINLNLPPVTIDEVMDIVGEIYNLDITKRGNFYTVLPGGLRTRQFSIDYLNVQRQGNSSISVSAGGSQGGGQNGGGQSGGFNGGGQNGGFNGGGQNGGFNGGGQNGRQSGGNGGGGGGQISTSTSTDFWSDLETAITNLIGVQNSGGGAGGGGAFGGLSTAGSRNQSTVTDEGKSVLVQPLTGIVIVTAFPHELDRVEEFINAAQESLRREVVIQIQFLEVILNKGFQYALDFNTFGNAPNNPSDGTALFADSDNDQAAEFLGGDIGLDGISNALQFSTNFSDFDAVFQLLQTRGTTQVISSPQLRVLNNQKAVFQDGSQEFFQTQADTTTVASGNNTTTNANNNLQQFFSGISMDITPQISANGEITLHVHPIISAVDEQTKSIAGQTVPLAITTTREIDSVIKAANGKIVVLGGLAFERNMNQTAGIPGVSQIPLLGDALEQRQTQSVKSEFIILLKPIMASEATDKLILQESNDRFRDINRAIDPFADN